MRSRTDRFPVALGVLLPDLARGLRAALATLVPFYFATATGHRELSWVALGGWLGTLADPGGARADRARVLATFTAAGLVTVTLASFASESFVTSIGFVTLASFAFSMVRAWGGIATSAGTLLLVAGAVGSARSGSVPWADGLAFAAGATWATFLSSIVWPIAPHFPLRVAIDRVWRDLEAYGTALEGVVGTAEGDERWGRLARDHHRRIRAAIEDARSFAVASRARRGGESRAGAGLRVSLGAAETAFPLLVAISEELESSRHGSAERERGRQAVRAFLSRTATLGRMGAPPPARGADSEPSGPSVSPSTPIDRLSAKLVDAAELRVEAGPGAEGDTSTVEGGPFRALGDAFSVRSVTFRHAVRVAAAVGLAAYAGSRLSPEHVHWVTVTTIAVLQPFPGATIKRAAERIVGTVLGSALAVTIALLVVSPTGLSLVMFPLSIAAVATKPRSYRLFTFFLTPVFVLIAERWQGDWWTAAARAGDAAIGGAIAGVASLVFPSWESPRLADAHRAALDAVEDYVIATLNSTGDRTARRRRVGLAIGDVEASLERLLAEPRRTNDEVTHAMQLVTYARRLSAAATTLDMHGGSSEPASGVADFVRAAIAEARGGEAAGPPPFTASPALARVVRHAELLASIGRAGSANHGSPRRVSAP